MIEIDHCQLERVTFVVNWITPHLIGAQRTQISLAQSSYMALLAPYVAAELRAQRGVSRLSNRELHRVTEISIPRA